MQKQDCKIRPACLADVNQITEIWRENYAQHGSFGNSLRREDAEQFFSNQIQKQDENFRFWVMEDQKNMILGWQSIMPFQANPHPLIYSSFAQSSTYVRKQYQQKGIGKILLTHALCYCEKQTEIRYVFGFVLNENGKSLEMCDSIGFVNMGLLPESNFPCTNLLIYKSKHRPE